MRSVIVTLIVLICSLSLKAQNPTLAVKRVDKFTKELIKQTSLYSFKEGSAVKLHFNIRSVDKNYFLQFNVPQAVSLKRGTEITLLMDNGKPLKLVSDNDIISLSESDISKRMIVCALDAPEVASLLKQQVVSIRVPTANKGIVNLNLSGKDQGMIGTAMALVN